MFLSASSLLIAHAMATTTSSCAARVRVSHRTRISRFTACGPLCAEDAAHRSTNTDPEPIRVSRRNAVASFTGLTLAACGTALPSYAATSDIASAYDTYSKTYDLLDGSRFVGQGLGLDGTRLQILQLASGDVLELGVGTGLNLPGYDFARISSLTAVDISEGMLGKAKARMEALELLSGGNGIGLDGKSVDVRLSEDGAGTASTSKKNFTKKKITFSVADAENLPFPDDSFDTVVDTFSLCVMNYPVRALSEVQRVLKKDGVALLVEHTVSNDNALLSAYQNVTSPAVTKMSKGCVWNQDVLALVKQAGLVVTTQTPSLAGLIVTVVARKE